MSKICRLARLAFFSLCILLCFGYARPCIREYLAGRAAQKGTLQGLVRAVELSPECASYHDLLGMVLLLSEGDWPGAQGHLTTATRLNPNESRYWLHLLKASQVNGDLANARFAAGRALSTGGTYGSVLWETGLFYLTQGDYQNAFHTFRRGLSNASLPGDRVVPISWKATHDLPLLLKDLIPPKPEPQLELLKLLITENRAKETDLAWKHSQQIPNGIPLEAGFAYIDYLLRQQRTAEALEAWHLLHPAAFEYATSEAGNLIYNGDFELEMLNGGFDWRCTSNRDADISVTTGTSAHGKRSLQITLYSEQIWDAPVRQLIPVKPNTAYEFSAYVRTQTLQSVSMPRFRLSDDIHQIQYVLTDELEATYPWSTIKAHFITEANSHLVTLKVVRQPGNSSITGSMWLDNVSLREVHRP